MENIGIKNYLGELKRVIVGDIHDPLVPELHAGITPTIPSQNLNFFKENAGKKFPREYVKKAKEEIENFASILENRGIIVDRPTNFDFFKPIVTDNWSTLHGNYAAMPRDILLVVKNKIIVAPMSWRCRFNEIEAYKELLGRYKKLGYKIIFPTKHQLKDSLYIKSSFDNSDDCAFVPILSETEPVFDAPDFILFNDGIILAQESLVTNKSGINLLKNMVGSEFKIYPVAFNCDHPMHLDDTFLPLREGLILANPEWVDIKKTLAQLPSELQNWEIIMAPEPEVRETDPPKYFTSNWLSMNVLTLDPYTVVVEENQKPLKELLKNHKFDIISVPFINYQCFSGSFHCATADIIRE